MTIEKAKQVISEQGYPRFSATRDGEASNTYDYYTIKADNVVCDTYQIANEIAEAVNFILDNAERLELKNDGK